MISIAPLNISPENIVNIFTQPILPESVQSNLSLSVSVRSTPVSVTSVQVFIPPVPVSETLKWCHYRSNFLCYWVAFFPKCCVLWCFYESDVLGCWLFPFTDGGNIYSNWELATYTNLWIPGKSNSSKTHIKSSFKKKGVV